MTTYFRNQPVATDDLDISEPFLLANTNAADTVFGFEHYAFSNTTANQGLHNTVTTPAIIGGVAPTTTTNPVFYGLALTTPVGMLQFSRGPNDAVTTVVTDLHSPPTGVTIPSNTRTDLLDFTGLGGALIKVYAGSVTTIPGQATPQEAFVIWNSLTFTSISNFILPSSLLVVSTGNILQLGNVNTFTAAPVIWTLKIVWI